MSGDGVHPFGFHPFFHKSWLRFIDLIHQSILCKSQSGADWQTMSRVGIGHILTRWQIRCDPTGSHHEATGSAEQQDQDRPTAKDHRS